MGNERQLISIKELNPITQKIIIELQYSTFCHIDDLEEFEKAVLETHKNNDEYREPYLKEIEKVKVLFELEKGR